jgi:hypothetical protein
MLPAMTNSLRTRTVALSVVALALSPAAAEAAGKTETLRVFSKDVAMTFTTADGTVHPGPPRSEPQPGDAIDVYAVDYEGTHRRHAKRWSMSDHTRCTFGTGAPKCVTHLAIGGSLLIFEGEGSPETLIAGTGRYRGATGRVISLKDVKGGADVVVQIRLRGRAGASSPAPPAPPPLRAEPAWERALRIRGEAMNRALG